MTAPAYTVAPDRLGGGVLLEMLDRGVRHFPVISPRGEIVGVIADIDLIAVETRNSFYVRRLIAGATRVEELVAAAAHIRPMVVALHDSRVAATSISAIYSVVARRAHPPPGRAGDRGARRAAGRRSRCSRSAATRVARRCPSSDVDSAIVWYGAADEDEVRPHLHEIGTRVVGGTGRLRPTARRARRERVRPAASCAREESWRRVARSWMKDPTQEQALILVSVLVDSRPVWGIHAGHPGRRGVLPRAAAPRPAAPARALRALLPPADRLPARPRRRAHRRAPRAARPQARRHHPDRRPRALGGDVGRRHARLDRRAPARRRRRRHAAGGRRPHAARGAYELIVELRVEHQIEQLARGEPPDDYIDPAALSPLTRSYLKEAFRAVAAVQKRVAAELQVGPALMLGALRGAPRDGAARAPTRRAQLPPRANAAGARPRYCVVDLELSGLDPRRHEIISFGAIPIDDGRVRLDGAVHGLVRPTRPLGRGRDPRARHPRRRPRARAAARRGARAAARGDDRPRARRPPRRGRARVPRRRAARAGAAAARAADRHRGARAPLAAERDGAVRGASLGELARRCGLPVHSPHTAIGDALTTAQLFIALAAHLDALDAETVGRLARAGQRLKALRALDGR